MPSSSVISLKITAAAFVISLDAPSAFSDFDPHMIADFNLVADSRQIKWNWCYAFSFHFELNLCSPRKALFTA